MDKSIKGWKPYLIVFGVLLLLLLYTQMKERQYQQTLEPIFAIKSLEVASFTIGKGSESVTIVKRDTSWAFELPDTGIVDTVHVREFLSRVLMVHHEEYVTEDTSKYDQYDLAETKSVRLVVGSKSGGEETLHLGRSRSDFKREYVRLSNDPKVYLLHDPILRYLGTNADWWRK